MLQTVDMEALGVTPYKISTDSGYSSVWEENSSQEMANSSFYDSFCKFTAIIKYLGCLPITFSKSSPGLKFSITSMLTLFSLFAFEIIYLFSLAWFSSEDPLVEVFMYLKVCFPLASKLLFFCQLPELVKLLQLMDTIDRDKCLARAKEHDTKKAIKAILWFLLVTLATSILPQNLITNLTPGSWQPYIFHCHSLICLTCQLAIYYFIAYQMCSFYDRYHMSLLSLVEQPCEEVNEEAVEDHRLAHGKLVNCIRFLNNSFNPFLGFLYLGVIIECLIECYDLIYNDRSRSRCLQALQMVAFLVFAYYPAVITDHFIQKNSDTMRHVLKMALKPLPDDIMFQLTYFLRHLKMNVAHVTAAGVTKVNKKLITKALSLFATFFVATLELQPLTQRGLAALRQTLLEAKSIKLS